MTVPYAKCGSIPKVGRRNVCRRIVVEPFLVGSYLLISGKCLPYTTRAVNGGIPYII